MYTISSAGILYAILVGPECDGIQRWKFAVENDKFSYEVRPVVDGYGTVYVCGENKIYAVNDNGALKWTFPLKGVDPQTLVIGYGGIIYVCAGDGKLHAIGEKK